MKKTTIAGSFLTVGLLGGGVLCGVQNDKIQAEVPGLDAKVTMEEAKAIAEKETNSTVESIELDRDFTGAVYEIDTNGFDVDIDGNSGDILKKERDDDDDDMDDDQSANANVTVTQDEAVAAAQKQVKGSVKDIELDDGFYEMEIRDGQKETDVYVNGTTGEVVIGETDLDD